MQILILENYNIYLYSGLSNIMKFVDTSELFGITLYNTNLHLVIENLVLDNNNIKLAFN